MTRAVILAVAAAALVAAAPLAHADGDICVFDSYGHPMVCIPHGSGGGGGGGIGF